MPPSKIQAIQTALTGDWQNATSINRALLRDNPKDIEALNRLGFAFTVLGRIKDAKSMYKKVLAIDELNPIALRNMKRLSSLPVSKKFKTIFPIPSINRTFLEETGKTKIIDLVNVTQPKIIVRLQTGQSLIISIKRSKIFILDDSKQYIGVMPDDIGKRLIKFIKGGNKYEAYIKSANNNNVVVFIKEVKRSSRFKNQPSFLQSIDNSLMIDKNSGIKIQNQKGDNDKAYLSDSEEEIVVEES